MIAIIFNFLLGPDGGDVRLLYALSDGRILCGTTVGLFVSDSTFEWKPLGNIRDLTPTAFFQIDNSTFLGGFKRGEEGEGLWISEDHGITWEKIVHGIPPQSLITGFYSVPPENSKILIFTESSGIYEYDILFSEVHKKDSPSDVIYSVSSLNDTVAMGTPDGIYISYDGGNSWSILWNKDTVYTVYIFSTDSSSYISFFSSKTLMEVYTGNFHEFWLSNLMQEVKEFLFSKDTLYAITSRGIWITESLKEPLWQEFNTGLNFKSVNTIKEYENSILCGASDGVYLLRNGLWYPENEGLQSCIVTSLIKRGDSLYASSMGSGILKKDNGEWELLNGDEPYIYGMDMLSNTFYCISPGKVIRGLDNGKVWESTGFLVDSLYSIFCCTDGIFVGAEDGIYMSTDGVSFKNIYPGKKVYSLTMKRNSHDTIYIGTSEGVYRSTSRDIKFINRSSDLPETHVVSVSMDRNNGKKILCSFGNYENGVFLSKDGGEHWDEVLTDEKINRVKFSDSSYLAYALSTENSLFLSVDSGKSFTPLECETGNLLDVITDFSNKKIYISSRNGIEVIEDTLPPQTEVSLNQEFSPDGDGENDSLIFNINFQDSLPISFWEMVIERLDSKDTLFYRKFNREPGNEVWDGYDMNGRIVGGCSLSVKLTLMDALLNKKTDSFTVVSSPVPLNTGDSLSLSPNSNKLLYSEDSIHIVYTSGNPQEVFLAGIKDSNSQFLSCISNTKDFASVEPTVEEDEDGNKIIAWVEKGEDRDYLVAGTYGDSTYFDTVYTGREISSPSMELTRDEILLTFSAFDENSNSKDVYMIRYNRRTRTWDETPENISRNAGESLKPTVFYLNSPVIIYIDNTKGEPKIETHGIDPPSFEQSSIEFYHALMHNHIIYIMAYDQKNKETFIVKYDTVKKWSSPEEVPFQNPEHGIFSIDSVLNIYALFKKNNGIYFMYKDHHKGWGTPVKINQNNGYCTALPHEMKREEIFWTEEEGNHYRIKYERTELLTDTIPPLFRFTIEDTLSIGDTLSFNISTEVLREKPTVFIKDSRGDSLELTVKEMPDFYTASGIIKGLRAGRATVIVRGTDLSNNQGETTRDIVLIPREDLVVEEKTYIYPNPVNRGEDLFFKFITGENCEIVLYLMNIGGRIITKLEKESKGGEENILKISTHGLKHDIYIIVMEVTGKDSGRRKKMIKKFIVK